MSTPTFLLYLVTWTLVALTPGPAAMCCLAQSTRHGFRASLTGLAGVQFGNLLLFVAVALGLGAILASAANALLVLRVLGAVYLFYVGLRIITSTFQRSPDASSSVRAAAVPGRSLFIEGLLVQITNPKALLFISALLPQFIDSHRSVPGQLTILGSATILVDTVVLSAYAFAAHCGVRRLRNSSLIRWLERAFGTALILFGVRLLTSRK